MYATAESDSSDEFFDAEENSTTPGKKKSPKNVSNAKGFIYPTEYDAKSLEKIKAQREEVEKKIKELTNLNENNPAKLNKIRQLPTLLTTTSSTDEFVEPKPSGRQRFRDLRQNMQNDDDENVGNTLTPESQNSSVEGVYYASQKTSHPFRILEQDTVSIQSMTSLGRVGRILAGSIDPSAMSVISSGVISGNSNTRDATLTKSNSSQQMPVQPLPSQMSTTMSTQAFFTLAEDRDDDILLANKLDALSIKTNESIESSASSVQLSESKMTLQEPDVIASTKQTYCKPSSSSADSNNVIQSRPVAPPRKKKKAKKLSNSSSENFNPHEFSSLPSSLIMHPPLTSTYSFDSDKKYKSIENRDIDIDDDYDEYDDRVGKASKDADTISIQTTESAIETFQRELESSFSSDAIKSVAGGGAGSVMGSNINNSKSYKSASLNRIYNNSSTSINNNNRPSPSNSGKSNSAPSRVSSIDPNQGLNLYKATRGRYVVKPQDEVTNKADGPTYDEVERIRGANSRERVNLAGTGTNSLGSNSRYQQISSIILKNGKIGKERRKSAGDEDIRKQINLYVRTHTESGKELTDEEILQQVTVKNLDTGENFPLSVVEEKLPELKKKMNPLSFHIMRLTSEVPEMGDEEAVDIPAELVPPADEEDGDFEEGSRIKRKTERLRKFFGSTMRKTVDKAKSIASEVSHARHKEDVADIEDVMNPDLNIKIKASNTNKGPYEFAKLQHVQDLSAEHTGAVWCMKFSSCGRLLATAGQDKLLRIWVLKDAYPFFQDMRTKYNTEKASPTPSQESLVSQSSSAEEAIAMATAAEKSIGPFMPKAFCTYTGHTSDLLDVSWSKNYFILSSSMDKTVRLWHISRKECLCCFQHIDFVTAIAFHPRDDRYFLSGSLDGKLRLWNIPDKKVALWNEVDGQTKLITAANFCQNGKFAVVGTYDGRCIFYTTDQLKYHTQIHVRSTRGRNATGRKISGIEPMPGEDKILVTSNDSRIRLYDLRDLNLSCKYKGYVNASSQIKASFSNDGKYIIAGSENQCIYIWKTHHDYAKLSSTRRDRNDFWEGIKAHNATVTCSIFAPHPEAIIKPDPGEMSSEEAQQYPPDPMVEQHKKGCGYVLVSADFNGAIKVFINKTKPKHSSLPYTAIMD